MGKMLTFIWYLHVYEVHSYSNEVFFYVKVSVYFHFNITEFYFAIRLMFWFIKQLEACFFISSTLSPRWRHLFEHEILFDEFSAMIKFFFLIHLEWKICFFPI